MEIEDGEEFLFSCERKVGQFLNYRGKT